MASYADVLVAGGGPIGAALALSLAGSGLTVVIAEARTGSIDDARTLAISHGTALILHRLGLRVSTLQSTAIEAIHVSQRGGFGRTTLRAAELDVPALGHVVSYARLVAGLDALLTASGVEVLSGAKATGIDFTADRAPGDRAKVQIEHAGAAVTMTARLLVLADGGSGSAHIPGIAVHARDYHQAALTALVTTEPAAAHTAYERFTTSGPAALLPHAGRYALVWTTTPDEANALAALPSPQFIARLNDHFALQRLRFIDTGPRAVFPLQLRYAKPVTGQRTALIGNAAQSLHPVAGQGFNLGMRDVRALALCIRESAANTSSRDGLGGAAMLSRYRAMRRWDATGGIAVTDFLVRGFSNDQPLLRAGRGLGLAALDVLPPARKWLARKMMFGISG